jgi:hypothetical protein
MAPLHLSTYLTLSTYLAIAYLFIGQNCGQNLVHRLGVKWYLSFLRALSHHTEFAHTYVH